MYNNLYYVIYSYNSLFLLLQTDYLINNKVFTNKNNVYI